MRNLNIGKALVLFLAFTLSVTAWGAEPKTDKEKFADAIKSCEYSQVEKLLSSSPELINSRIMSSGEPLEVEAYLKTVIKDLFWKYRAAAISSEGESAEAAKIQITLSKCGKVQSMIGKKVAKQRDIEVEEILAIASKASGSAVYMSASKNKQEKVSEEEIEEILRIASKISGKAIRENSSPEKVNKSGFDGPRIIQGVSRLPDDELRSPAVEQLQIDNQQ